MKNVLKEIISKKKDNIIEYKKNYSIKKIDENIKNRKDFIDFSAKLKV